MASSLELRAAALQSKYHREDEELKNGPQALTESQLTFDQTVNLSYLDCIDDPDDDEDNDDSEAY